MEINREQLAWAAGLFEGEGCFRFYQGSGTKRHASAKLVMTDEDVIRCLHTIIGVGKVYGPIIRKQPNTKPIWEWTTTTFEDAQVVVALLWPWLCSRRRLAARSMLIKYHDTGLSMKSPSKKAQRPQEHNKIRQLYVDGMKQSELARLFQRTPTSICQIVNGRTGTQNKPEKENEG